MKKGLTKLLMHMYNIGRWTTWGSCTLLVTTYIHAYMALAYTYIHSGPSSSSAASPLNASQSVIASDTALALATNEMLHRIV